MEICIERKRLQLEESGAVGILFQPDRDSSSRIRGVALLKIVQGSAADRGGLRAGDVVVEWNGHRVADDSFSSFGEHHSSMKKGQRTRYLVRRSDSTLEIDLVAGPRSKDNIAVSLGKYVFDNYGCSAYKAFWDEHNLQEKLEVNRIRPSPGGR
ncbi:MAG: PDZ domain-containing protein [Acidobacteriota bacterium]